MMDYKRIILYIALAIVSMSLWNAWQADNAKKAASAVTRQQAQAVNDYGVPQIAVSGATTQQKTASSTVATQQSMVPSLAKQVIPQSRLVEVHTGTLNVWIDSLGGNIVKVSLPKYPDSLNTPKVPFTLLNDNPETLYIAQSGLTGPQGPDTTKGQVQYTSAEKVYTLKPGEKQLKVDLQWKNAQGLQVTKVFTFTPNKYVVQVAYNINNQMKKAWAGNLYSQIKRKEPLKKKHLFQVGVFEGAAISSEAKPYKKISFKDMREDNLSTNSKGGWVVMQQHYFLSAWVPNEQQINHYYTNVSQDGTYTIGFVGPRFTVAPGDKHVTKTQFYAGPQLTDRLQTIAPNLDLTVDYGWLWFISMAIFWLMKKIYSVVGNWGWSIVLVTIFIKAVFYKLSATSYRSMAKMRRLTPKMQALKERHGGDKQKMSQATMELYKKEKVNPFGGCLPIIVQIPFFIALYYVLIESVELRQAPFIFWIHDLSVKDPFYILPLLMGISMFIQQKLSPPPPDPMQAKMMMLLPVVFTIFFMNFPAGLVLYWFVNNTLSILQQWYVMRKLEKELDGKKGKAVAKSKK